MKKEIVDFETHIKILSFLTHIQSIGVITEEQRIYYSNYVQDYLLERKNNLEIMENLIKEFRA